MEQYICNVLILLGRAENLKRIADIIQDVDQAANNGIQIIPLHHASAVQIAQVLNNLQAAARAAGETASVSIAVDDRSNSILLSGPRGMRLKMRLLIAQLDAPASTPAGNTEVVYLKYLEAKTFAPLLGKIAQNIIGKSSGDSGPSAAPAVTTSNTAAGGKTPVRDAPENMTSIQAEPNSNAIIMTAPPTLMKALKIIVNKLDIRPAQVLVEAIIVEIDETNLTALGIQWGSVGRNGSVVVASSSQGSLPTSFPPLGAGIIGIIPGTDITAILSVLQNQNGVDILSTPSIVVLDNQKATIEVGQNVPMQTGSYSPTGTSNAAGTPTPFTTIEVKPVTLKLDVTPQLNLGTSVRLKLDLKNDTLQNPQNPGLTPIVNTSKITNSVIINSSDILVLGGLISNSNNENINKVPILGDLPIVGKLFQQKTSGQQKRNLMVFIKPVIMHNESEAMMISQEKYGEMRSTQAHFKDDLADIGKKEVDTLLPPWKNNKDLPTPFETDQQ
jgi:general secretion pathway protein D